MAPALEPMVGRYVRLEIDGVPHRIYFEEAGPEDEGGIPLVCLRLDQLADCPPHRAAATLLKSLWSMLAAECGLSTGCPSELPELDNGTPYACGMEELESRHEDIEVRLTARNRPLQ